jgi:hypothetical protein
MKQQRKEFIIQAHAAACSDWKTKIETEFPKMFKKDKLAVGKWYKSNGFLRKFEGKFGNSSVFGFKKDGSYYSSLGFHEEDEHILATDEEVSEALIEEAKRRGYKNGNYKCISGLKTYEVKDSFFLDQGELWMGKSGLSNQVFENGVWAEIIEEENPVYEWQYIYNCPFDGCSKSTGYYTSKKEFKRLVVTLPPIKKVKESKRIRK